MPVADSTPTHSVLEIGGASQRTLAAHDAAASNPDDGVTRSLARGDAVGRYIVLDVLGRGGMGVVYAAYDPELDRKIALKLLAGGERTTDGRRTRMLREAQALARVSHPNVVTVHDVGTFEGGVFLAMEFVDGGTLTQWLAAAPRTWQATLSVVCRAGAGLAAVHRAGLVHRDVKPDNIMVGSDGRVRMMDFGLVRADAELESEAGASARALALDLALDLGLVDRSGASAPLTQVGAVIGTPAYMSFEQLVSAEVGPQSDQYSFCVALHEALLGRRPHASTLPHELVAAMLERDTTALPEHRGVPRRIVRAIERGLSRSPADRFADMNALLAVLERDPAGRRRGAVRVAAASVVVAVAFGVPAFARVQDERACASEAEGIAAVWNDEARDRFGDAVAATGLAYAPRTGEYTTALLDAYATAWRAVRQGVCLAHNDGTMAPDQAAIARECLDERRDRVAALLATAVEANAHSLNHIARAVGLLAAVASCTDASTLAQRNSISSAEPSGADVAALRKDLLQIDAYGALGQYAQGRVLGEDVLARARATGISGLVADAHLGLGRLLAKLGEFRAAADHLENAYVEAGRTDAHPTMLAAVAVITGVIGSNLDDYDLAMHWADLGEMHLDAAGARGGIEEAFLLAERASVQYDWGHVDDAIDSASRALALGEEHLGPEHPYLALPLRLISAVHSRRGELDDAQALGRRALAIEEAAFGPEHPDIVGSLNHLATVDYLLENYDDARAQLERALVMRAAQRGADHPSVAGIRTNLGAAYLQLGEPRKAIAEFEAARAVLSRTPDASQAIFAGCLSNLAAARLQIGEPEAAIASAEQAIAIHDRIGEHVDLALVLRISGDAHRVLGRNALALAAFQRSIDVLEREDETGELINPLIGLARVHITMNAHAEAEALIARADRVLQRHPDRADEMSTLVAKAELAWARGRRADALALARAAARGFATVSMDYDTDRRELDAWLAAHDD